MRGLSIIAMLAISVVTGTAAEPAKIRREAIEWCDMRVLEANKTDLPRVLLVGDSITMGYFDAVARQLEGKAYLGRLATSASVGDPALIQQLELILRQYKFAVIHFNNGLHGVDYTEDDYRRHFPDLLWVFQKHAPRARLIWASTTPWRRDGANVKELHANNERVKRRNTVAAELVGKKRIPINDLYSLLENHPEYWSEDGVHFNAAGKAAQVPQVARYILNALAAGPG